MKLFDDIFRRNVDKVFSNYNADHLADEGWNSFMAARKARRRRRAVILFWARAASVALIVGIGALIGYLTIKHKPDEDIVSVNDTELKKEIAAPVRSGSSDTTLPAIADLPEQKMETAKEKLHSGLQAEEVSKTPDETGELPEGVTPVHINTIILPAVTENRFLLSGDSLNNAIEQALKKFEGGETVETANEEGAKRSGRTMIMAGLSGMLTSVGNASSTSPGVSAGFYLEQKITKRISLRPGLALAMNSLGIDNSSGNLAVTYSLPLIDGNSGTPTSFKGQLNVLAMELPLNVVFKVYNKGRSGISFSAGSSTMIYFSQQLTGDYVNKYTQEKYDAENGSTNTVTMYSTVMVKNSYGSLRRTDFFGLANFSAGYSLPYGKTGAILIEPFMQFPVRELTALHLHVRNGGMSVKIYFGSKESEK